MKKVFRHIYIFFLPGLISAQLVINNQWPSDGAQYNYVDIEYEGILNLSNSGKNQVWNYYYFEPSISNEITYYQAEKGNYANQMTESEVVAKSANGQEVYYKISGNSILEVGRTGFPWLMSDLNSLILYDTKPVIKKAGLQYNDRYADRSTFTVTVGRNLMTEVRDKLPYYADSLRLEVEVLREGVIDGEGELLLPDGKYDVLREREEITITTKVYFPTAIGWNEISGNGFNNAEVIIPPAIKKLTRYRYWDKIFPLPVMEIETYTNRYHKIKFVNLDSTIPSISSNRETKDVIAVPNPTYGDITFQLVNLPFGTYQLQITDIFSKKLYDRSFKVGYDRKIKTDLGFLPKGTYVYSIIDSFGNKITTKRVVIITP